ncbi:ubiquinone biosynthesis monooxygenase COQ6, mitochondrial [Macrosteles quadrilineatus]|uniref:ubiquinone biosynthesis monooxygenase COQ6, mitochondrial n=1 Tax=Macrosteles quadrilineatus TaxID=74068 RepID=UPI0023E231B8|nr:ubiquinone biosynthesis monooxygenase COQ6, mitochondrial [Macrosteles quadrilineatus]
MSSCVRFISNTTSTKHFDVIVSGGGMIGTALSCLLAQTPSLSSHKILLLESNKPKQWSLSPAYSNRVSSVNEATKHLMESIGAWEHISKARFKPVMNMKVWDCSGAKVEFNNDNSTDPVAYIVENDILVDSVEKELKKADNVTVMNDTRVEEYTLPKHGNEEVQLRLTDGSTVTCNLLVGADGANSAVRKAMGVQYVSWKYNQTAVVATLKLAEGSQNDTAWQRFLHSGPVALLPLTNELTSLVWSTSLEEAKRLLKLPNDSFVDALNDALWKEPVRSEVVTAVSSVARRVLGLVESTAPSSSPQPPNVASVVDSSRAAFPLAFGHAASYVAQAVALVGDAAHKVHPLAGQGVNLGYGDIKCLVDQLDQAAHLGKPLGHIGTLREYERLRQAHNLPLMMAIDLMARVYSTTNPVLLAAGNVALQVADSLSPIKTMMRNRAAS